MIRDAVEIGVVVAVFAAWVTVHVVTAAGLLGQRPRWHGGVALVLPVLAPYWAARQGMKALAATWLVFAAIYGFARLLVR